MVDGQMAQQDETTDGHMDGQRALFHDEQLPRQVEMRAVEALWPDPKNREIFDPLEGPAFAELIQSVAEHGLINPITIKPDGTVIAGEQRLRAAQAAGVVEVPVIVWDVDDETAEALRLEENLRRRDLKPSEKARAVRRWYEVHHLNTKTGQPLPGYRGTSTDPLTSSKRVGDLAKIWDVKPPVVSRYNRIADLVPSLMRRLDDGDITVETAYKWAQLPEEEQEALAATWEARDRQWEQRMAARDHFHAQQLQAEREARQRAEQERDESLAALKQEIEANNQKIAELEALLDESAVSQVRRELEEQITTLKEANQTIKEKAAQQLSQIQLAAAEQLALAVRERDSTQEDIKRDAVARAVSAFVVAGQIDPAAAAARFRINSYWFKEGERQSEDIPLIMDWLKRYEVEVNQVLGRGPAPEDPVSIAAARQLRARQLFEKELGDGS